MKFINKTILNRLPVFLGLFLLSVYLPTKALALSNDPQQHFTSTGAGSLSSWNSGTVGSCASGIYALSLNGTLSDPYPGESAQNAIVDTSSSYAGSCAVTVTYTDPSPGTGGTQNFIDKTHG